MPFELDRQKSILARSPSQPFLYTVSYHLFNLIGRILTPEWDKRLLGIRQLPIQTIIDIGANEGHFARYMNRLFPLAKIHAFEPLPLPFVKLSRWAKQHPQKIWTYNLALGDKREKVTINSHLYFHPSSSILPTTALCESTFPMVKKQEKVIVSQSTLDQEMAPIDPLTMGTILIKLDVQGYEDRVIRGGQKLFAQATACIVEISLDLLYEQQAQFRDIFSLLDHLGYTYAGNLDQILGRDGQVRYLNAVFLKEGGGKSAPLFKS
jgi:FkbM family methyltransferase